LPVLLSVVAYLALGVFFWRGPSFFPERKDLTPPPRTAVLLLIDEAMPPHTVLPVMPASDGGGGNGDPGPQVLADQPIPIPQPQSPDSVDEIPTGLPTEPMPPQPHAGGGRPGGTGQGIGSGGGSGGGTGTGTGTGVGPGKQAVTLSIEDLDFENFEKPDYPKLAQDAGIEGEVMLHLLVDEEGVPTKVWATTGNPLFIPNTIKAALRWRFGALRKKRIPAPAEVEFLFRYKLLRPGQK
jgi:hypothetical protein